MTGGWLSRVNEGTLPPDATGSRAYAQGERERATREAQALDSTGLTVAERPTLDAVLRRSLPPIMAEEVNR